MCRSKVKKESDCVSEGWWEMFLLFYACSREEVYGWTPLLIKDRIPCEGSFTQFYFPRKYAQITLSCAGLDVACFLL